MDRPAPHKESIVLLAYSEPKKKHYIIVKLAYSCRAQLIRIDAESGVLRWDQAVGRDTFENEAEALAYLQENTQVEVLTHAKYVLGYVVLGPVALLLLAEAVRVSATLPGGHEIKTVTQSRWHRINLQQADLDVTTQAAAKAELDRGIEKTMSFPMDGAHYFCETLDITRPFPSERPVSEPSWPFIWNKALTLPFRAAGLDGLNTVCPALLQGMAESRDLEDFDGRRFSYCLISRKCRLHVGPRYKARGLNENADPGNEIECDQVVWRHSDPPDKPLAWSRYTWRRGSVPLWWTVNIRNGGMGEAEIKIRSTNTFKGSRRYVRRLQKRYLPDSHLEPDSDDGTSPGADASYQVPVVFFSLLRKGTPDRDRSEAKLAEAFDFLAGQLRSMHKLPVSYVALDWHQMDKELGSEALVEGFWAQLSSLLPSQGFALGTMSKVGPDQNDTDGQELTSAVSSSSSGGNLLSAAACARGCSPVGRGWVARWFKQQRGVTRYNCADSLDRTNVGSFFGAVQVFVEQCRELDIAIAANNSSAASVARQALVKRQAAAATAAVLAAAGSSNSTVSGPAAGRPPVPGVSGSAAAQDKRSGSSNFLSSLGKDFSRGLNTVMGEMKLSSRSSSPRGTCEQALSSLNRDLRVSSAPNIASLQHQQQQMLSGSTGDLLQQQQQRREGKEQLPPGWEAKYDAVNKRVFYVDHNTKTTTWNKPQWSQVQQQQQGSGSPVASNGAAAATATNGSSSAEQQLVSVSGSGATSTSGSSALVSPGHSIPGSRHHSRRSLPADEGASGSDSDTGADKERYEPLTPWCMFDPRNAKVRHFARRINPAALSAIAELFLMNGDMCAWLYTGSPAMHSEKITMFEPDTSRLKKAGAGTYSNSFIAIRRRYNNVLMDEERKMQMEIFLGIKNKLYFPTLYVLYREPDAVPDDFPESDDDESSDPDPLGLLTWPLENKPRGLAGSAAALVGLGSSAASVGSKDRQPASSAAFDGADLLVERYGSHTRSFSSEKIFQDFRDLHRAGAGPYQQQQLSPSAAASSRGAVNKGESSPSMASGRPPVSGGVRPMPVAAAVTTAAAAATLGGNSLADFDSELSDKAPPAASVLKPFEDPLGLL